MLCQHMGFPWKSPEPSGKCVLTQAKPCVAVVQKLFSSIRYNSTFPPCVSEGSSEDHLSFMAKITLLYAQEMSISGNSFLGPEG